MAEIRRLTETDIPLWLLQRLALWPDHEAEEFLPEMVQMVDGNDKPAFGAFVDGVLAGFAEAAERAYGEGCDTSPVGWLEGIYVEPAFRRQGIAAQLVGAVTDWASQRGYAELGSDALIENRISVISHRHWGFKETKRIVTFRKELK